MRSIGVSNKAPCKPYPALFSKMSIVTDLASRLLFKWLAAPGAGMPVAYRQGGAGECRTEMQSVYDSRGALTRTPVKVCAR